MGDKTKLVMKIGGIVVPVVVAILSGIYGDFQPMARDFCGLLLPPGTIAPRFISPEPSPRPTGDAGATTR